MPTVQSAQTFIGPVCPLPQTKPAAKAAAKPAAPASVQASAQDSLAFQSVKQGSAAASAAGTLITLPTEALKTTQTIAETAQILKARAAVQNAGLGAKVLAKVAASGKLIQGTEYVAKAANAVMNAPVIGKLTQSHVAQAVNTKVMPVVNALGSGVGVVENGFRFQKARAQGNTAGQVVSGLQIGLNTLSGVSGFFKGRGQAISAVAGIGSLVLEGISQLGGVGKVK